MKLIRNSVAQLQSYAWEESNEKIAEKCNLRPQDIVRFDQNTLPPSLLQLGPLELNDYPEPSYANLTTAIAKYLGAKNSQIVVGAGADEVIDDIIKAFVDPGDKIVLSTPTYSMYKVCAGIMGAEIIEIQRRSDFSIDFDLLAKKAKNVKLVFICNPNNPDGSLVPLAEIQKFTENFEGVVVVDEAYFEFCKQTAAPLTKKYKNLIVIRTFSKAFGLAGARIGYAISSEELVAELNKVRPPSSVSTPSVMLALRAMADLKSMQNRVQEILAEQNRVAAVLKGLGFFVFPSTTNFLLFRATNKADADRLFQKSMENGFVFRNLSGKAGCENCLRITIRDRVNNDKLLSVIGGCQDGIIFDIDGVLVDVSKSYKEAIRQTVLAVSGKKTSNNEIEQIKQKPNSNNDWDVSYALAYGIDDLKSIDRSSKAYFKVKLKFQDFYLGGLRDFEQPIAKLDTFRSLLSLGYKLGIVTSRPRAEALYVLDRFFPKIFDPNSVVALEDCSVEKPNPEPLLLAKTRMRCRAAFYVGDTINDSLAAKAAKIKFISVTPGLPADFFIQSINQIKKVEKCDAFFLSKNQNFYKVLA